MLPKIARSMSLVDYASSSDDDVPEPEQEELRQARPQEPPKSEPQPPTQPPPPPPRQSTPNSTKHKPQQPTKVGTTVSSGVEKLPDASVLLSSPLVSPNLMNASDHSTRVAAAMAENASRKRDSNAFASSNIHRKIPRSSMPHSRNTPDTVSGRLVPPQLTGRSNIVTEDIGKLFVKRHSDSTPH